MNPVNPNETDFFEIIRIEIHSESIKNFPNHSGICIRTKQFHADLVRKNFSIRINSRPIQNHTDFVIRMNPNFSELIRA